MSSVYTFADHILPSGTLKLVLTNDHGSSSVSVSGSRIKSVAQVTEEVEQNGIGGVLRIPDFQVEIDDPDGILKSTIFDRATVTKCDASIVLNVGGVDQGIMYGDVDLTTIEYPSYYDDEAGTERHSCKLVVFSLMKRLEKVTLSTLITAIDTFKVSKTIHVALASVSAYFGATGANVALGGSSASWTTAGYAGGYPDGLTAQIELVNNGDYSDYLQITGFTLIVPPGSTVKGFMFRIHYKTDGFGTENGIKFHSVKLVKGGAVSGSDFAPAGNIDSSVNTSIDVGGTSTLGGLTFTPLEASASDTGVAFALERTSVKALFDVFAFVDWVEMTVYYEPAATGDRYVVKELEIIQALQEAISSNTASVTHSVSQNFTHLDSANPNTIETYDHLYHIWKVVSSGLFDRLWNTGTTGSFAQLRSAVDVLKAIAGMRVAYPILVYAPGTGKVHFKIKQRGSGTVYAGTDLGILKSSSLQSFIGYDAFKINMLVNGLLAYSPSTITEAEFALVAQSFSFDSYFGVSHDEVYISSINLVDISHYMWVPDGTIGGAVSNVNRVDDGSNLYSTFASFLLAKFLQFWGNNQMYTRVYQGTGIGGASPVEMLDQVTIDSVAFTIISIKRDLIANEMTLKLVQF